MKELATALNAFQAEVVTVGKSAANPFFKSKYAPLNEILKAAQPILTKHGLSVVQLPSHIEGSPALTTIVLHSSGQSTEATTPLILAKDDPQGQGSAITYMRRYAYAAALGIVIDEDDDGNRASAVGATRPYTTKPSVGSLNPGDRPATSVQKVQITAYMRAAGIADENMAAVMASAHGIEDPKTMTSSEARRVIEELEAGKQAVAA